MSKRLASAKELGEADQGFCGKHRARVSGDHSKFKRSKMASPMDIDEDLHSRQLAVYGRESMHRMSQASVLIVGAGGLGVEIGTLATCLHIYVHFFCFTSCLFIKVMPNMQPRMSFLRVSRQ